MKNNLNNKIFLIILLVLSCGILIKFVRNSNEYNYVDNRMSYKFQIPSFESLLSNEYQAHLEDVIADQMPKYNYFKLLYLKIINYVNVGTISLFKLDKLDKYIRIGSINLYKDYLLYNATTNDDFASVSRADIDEINNIVTNTNANIYLYFIETDSNYNFETNYKVDSVNHLTDNLKIKKENISSLNISSFDDYKNYFYKTDHHWNHVGSYMGYKDIAKLMNFNYVLDPQNEICFKKNESYGSKTKSIAGIKSFKDEMCMYQYNYPEFDIYASGEKISKYGSTSEELVNSTQISYGSIYGGDYGEIIFINKEADSNKKLLLYANSFSNAINKLLAANYKETYVIDGRYYSDESIIDYINDKEIDDVLILGNCMLFWDNISW